MRTPRRLVSFLALLAVLAGSRGAAQDSRPPTPGLWTPLPGPAATPVPLATQPCDIPGVPGTARCGTLSVWENRASKQGRKIDLKIVVLPATGPDHQPDPLVFLEGGPGESATEGAASLATILAAIREKRDILLADQRGTGGSHPLNCTLFEPAKDLQSYLGEFFPAEAARRCRTVLEKDADLTQYTTPTAADDLDDVRAALGYERLNLFGASYGTRLALVYMRRHPNRVRSAILHGVSPTDQTIPLTIPRDTDRALDGILGDCLADEACRAAFPEARRELHDVIRRLASSPSSVKILHPETGELVTVRLTRDVAAEALRYLAYSPSGAGEVPAVVHAAASGDDEPLAEIGLFFRRNLVSSGSMGLYLSVTCAEDVSWIRPGEGESIAAGTVLGDYRLRQQRAACAAWPKIPMPRPFRRPVRSGAPVLLLTGYLDPVTPPSNAEAAARALSCHVNVVVPHGGHSFDGLDGLECVQKLESDFVERGNVGGLDTDCVLGIRRRPFATALPLRKPIRMSKRDLNRFAGSYASDGGGPAASIERTGSHLIVRFPGQPATALVPVAPGRFAVADTPLADVRFEVDHGKVAKAVFEQNGTPETTLVPKP